jgi:hypothetical protein
VCARLLLGMIDAIRAEHESGCAHFYNGIEACVAAGNRISHMQFVIDPLVALRANRDAADGSRSGAVATSIVTTAWEDKTTYMHAELSGLVDRTGETARTLANMGFSSDSIRLALDRMAQSQSVMLATNEIMLFVAVVFALAALVIWLAPRPTRKVDMTKAGH